jgi:hypothetical protein
MNKYVKKELKKRAEDDLSFLDFQNTFNTEEACREYLFKLRWPNGLFVKTAVIQSTTL